MGEGKNFWTSVSGILTGGAAFLTAATTLYTAIWGATVASNSAAVSSPVQNVGKTVAPSQKHFVTEAVIDDPDGYTNVRSMKSSTSTIVATIYQNEHFHTYTQDGNWWQVKTANGKVGYMHVSKIKLLSE